MPFLHSTALQGYHLAILMGKKFYSDLTLFKFKNVRYMKSGNKAVKNSTL